MAQRRGHTTTTDVCRLGAAFLLLGVTVSLAGCQEPAPTPSPEASAPLPSASANFGHGTSLLPSRHEERRELEEARSQKLEQTLSSIAGISEAHVLLALPLPAPLLGDGGPEPGKASVVLVHTTDVPPLSEGEVRKLVAGSVHGIDESHIVVLFRRAAPRIQAASPTVDLVRFGPIVVTRSSAGAARTLIAVAIGTAMTLLTVVLGLWLRLRRGHS